jgi:hypothetical protein
MRAQQPKKKVYSNIDAMIEKIRLDNILFLDIETVPEAADFNELDAEKDLWEHKPNTSEKTNILLKSSMTERGFGLNWENCVYFCGVFCQQRRYPKLRVTL